LPPSTTWSPRPNKSTRRCTGEPRGLRPAGGEGDFLTSVIDFRIPLASPPAEFEFFEEPAELNPNCPGPGQAGKGFLCLYLDEAKAVIPLVLFNEDAREAELSPGKTGFILRVGEEDEVDAFGEWAVTAP
jgi:hypothetical protein